MDEKALQEKINDIKQQLIQMKTSQWGQNDSWTPYQYYFQTSYSPSSSKVYPAKYYKMSFKSPIDQPALVLRFYGYNATYHQQGGSFDQDMSIGWWRLNDTQFGDSFSRDLYIYIPQYNFSDGGSYTYTNLSDCIVSFCVFSTQPGELMITEITQSEFKNRT